MIGDLGAALVAVVVCWVAFRFSLRLLRRATFEGSIAFDDRSVCYGDRCGCEACELLEEEDYMDARVWLDESEVVGA